MSWHVSPLLCWVTASLLGTLATAALITEVLELFDHWRARHR
jgi:hypothetical protein